MRAMGLDFGERRIGVALSDDGGRLAVPWGVVERDTDRRAVYRLADLAREEGVGVLVLGEPRHPETGEPQPAAERIRRFGHKLEKAAGLPVRFVEETLTTVEAAARLDEAGVDHRARPERLDAVAAQIVLQQALDEGAA